MSRSNLLHRVANALLGLESLSDGKTARIDPNRVHGGDGSDLQVLRDMSAFEFHAAELDTWCNNAEQRIEKERKRDPRPMTALEENYWFIEEWEGKDAHTVAERTGMSVEEVWRKRERAGRNAKDGRERVA